MIKVDGDEVRETAMLLMDTLREAETEPEVAIAAMMTLCGILAGQCSVPREDVLDWAVRVLDEEE